RGLGLGGQLVGLGHLVVVVGPHLDGGVQRALLVAQQLDQLLLRGDGAGVAFFALGARRPELLFDAGDGGLFVLQILILERQVVGDELGSGLFYLGNFGGLHIVALGGPQILVHRIA